MGCASKPILIPNDKYNRVGHAHSERDVESCELKAEAQMKKSRGRRIQRGAVKGLAMGALIGGIAGSSGRTGAIGGAALGGAAGGAAGILTGAFETPEEARRALIGYCLQQKGYSVAGWD